MVEQIDLKRNMVLHSLLQFENEVALNAILFFCIKFSKKSNIFLKVKNFMKNNIKGYKKKDESIFLLKLLNEKIDNITDAMIKNHILDISEILGDRRRLFFRSLGSGIAKGVGIGIGVTVITAILIIILQKIVTLNIPIIGEYIADIVDIVEKSR